MQIMIFLTIDQRFGTELKTRSGEKS